MNIKYVLSVIVLSFFTLYLTGCKHQYKSWSANHHDEALHYLTEELELTNKQTVKVKQVLSEISHLKKKGAEMKSDWHYFIQEGLADKNQVPDHQQFIEQQIADYRSLLEKGSEQLLTLRSVLTVEQLEMLRSSINNHRHKHS